MRFNSRRSVMLFFLSVLCLQQVKAADSTRTVKATILLPLYLDSVFNYSGYQYGNTLPRFLLPALEFYNGVQLAADSLEREGIKARVEIIDSRNSNATQSVFRESPKPGFIIGVVQNGTELKNLSSASLEAKTPFISATYPNDGGVTFNPTLLIVNSTLKSHCVAIYKYLQRNYRRNNLVFVTRKSGEDDRIKRYFKEVEKIVQGEKIKWKMVSLPDTFNAADLAVYLDSNKTNTILGGSFDKDFALRIIGTLSDMRTTYTSNVFGMPTWDELPLEKPAYNGIDVYYSTPFVSYSANAEVFNSLNKKFKKITNSRPSDMAFKGFEITYRFVKILYDHPDDFMAHINDKQYTLFADFDFEANLTSDKDERIEYWENKKLYFVKKTDGQVKGVY